MTIPDTQGPVTFRDFKFGLLFLNAFDMFCLSLMNFQVSFLSWPMFVLTSWGKVTGEGTERKTSMSQVRDGKDE